MSNANNTHRLASIHIHGSNISKTADPILTGNETKTNNTNMVLVDEYIQTLTSLERQGLAIAKDHLGPSFDMKRSIGFLRWKDARNKK